ncbi:MAG: glycosyltransferase [Polyangiaceae bacterium]
MTYFNALRIEGPLEHVRVEKYRKYRYRLTVNGRVYHEIGSLPHERLRHEELPPPSPGTEIVFVHPFANYLASERDYVDLWLGNWIFPFFHLLREHGYPVALANDFVEGVVNVAPVTLFDHLGPEPLAAIKRRSKLVMACAELSPRVYDAEDVYFVKQNPTTVKSPRDMHFHLFERDLVPRRADRPERLATLGYFGCLSNLHEEFQKEEFTNFLRRLDVAFRVVGPDEASAWSDYADVDVVLAIRPGWSLSHDDKPASKLVNAWRAGVPFLAARESAYVDLAREPDDAIFVDNKQQVTKALRALLDPGRYAALRRRALARQAEYSDARIAERYYRTLTNLVGRGTGTPRER